MRAFALGLILSTASLPCLAQTVLKSEPFILGPYEIAFVHDASCPVGKVLKVTGAIRGLNRRKACVVLASEQASLATTAP
jgi:predicted thioesterase